MINYGDIYFQFLAGIIENIAISKDTKHQKGLHNMSQHCHLTLCSIVNWALFFRITFSTVAVALNCS